MKIEYSVKRSAGKFDIEKWLGENKPAGKKTSSKQLEFIENEYFELIDEFKEFLNSSEQIIDEDGLQLKPVDIFSAVEYYKIRIQKLLLIINLKLYKTHNINKQTQVRYIVMRAYWIDDNGKPFRHFSKNVGAENKVLVSGKIPVKVLESVEDYIRTLMWDQYWFEYLDDSEAGIDSEGNIVIPRI